MKEQILKLRNEGKTYNEIVDIVGCSKGTVSYHCGKGQKEKTINRTRKYRKGKRAIFLHKADRFLRAKIRNYKLNKKTNTTKSRFNYESAYNKMVSSPYCYLTGQKLDLEDSSSYELDHKIPRSRGGSNSLKNMGVSSKLANQAKRDLTPEEFIELCIKVCEYNGFKIIKE